MHYSYIDYGESEYRDKTLKTLKTCKLGLKTKTEFLPVLGCPGCYPTG